MWKMNAPTISLLQLPVLKIHFQDTFAVKAYLLIAYEGLTGQSLLNISSLAARFSNLRTVVHVYQKHTVQMSIFLKFLSSQNGAVIRRH